MAYCWAYHMMNDLKRRGSWEAKCSSPEDGAAILGDWVEMDLYCFVCSAHAYVVHHPQRLQF